jgi:heterodisulfide reductase subunit B
METLLTALGAKTVEWNYKTECCGAGMTMASEDTVLELSHKILANAASTAPTAWWSPAPCATSTST